MLSRSSWRCRGCCCRSAEPGEGGSPGASPAPAVRTLTRRTTADVSKFWRRVDGSQLSASATTPEPQPTGYSMRWYVSRLSPGSGQVVDDGNEGNFKPTLLERVQPYAVYVPTTYRPGRPTPL